MKHMADFRGAQKYNYPYFAHQNVGQIHNILIANKSSENVAKLTYLESPVENQN
jgi:hypothetical protein